MRNQHEQFSMCPEQCGCEVTEWHSPRESQVRLTFSGDLNSKSNKQYINENKTPLGRSKPLEKKSKKSLKKYGNEYLRGALVKLPQH